MKKIIILIASLFLIYNVYSATPSRSYTYTSGQTINPTHVTGNEDNIFSYLQAGVELLKSPSAGDTSITNVGDIALDSLTADDGTGPILIYDDIELLDGEKLLLGTGSDGEIYSSSDDIYIRNVTSDKDIIISVNDGGSQTTLQTYDASVPAVISSVQPSFCAYAGSSQDDIALTNPVTILFDAERFDQGSDFDLATETFTAPVTGKYILSLNVNLTAIDNAATSYVLSLITSNQTYYWYATAPILAADGNLTVNITVVADMDVADTAYCAITQTGGTQQTDFLTGGYHTFSGALLH